MGSYNPYAPKILGQEWVPIRDEDMFLSPAVNSVEVGHRFTLAASHTLQDCRFYTNKLPQTAPSGEVMQISVYPAGTEDQTGPIRSVIIPVTNGGVTGNTFVSTTIAAALESPADDDEVTLSGGVPDDASLELYFGTNQYSQLLNGKRILAVNLIYVATSSGLSELDIRVRMTQPPSSSALTFASSSNLSAPLAGPGRPQYQRLSLGEATPFWSTSPFTTNERMPWTYATLQRFEFSSPNRITVRWDAIDNASGALFLQYAALEVIYCEERRVVVASQAFGGLNGLTGTSGFTREYIFGTNAMPARHPVTLAANPTLDPGQYDVVISSPGMGVLGASSQYPVFNGLRQLYALPTHPATIVNIPYPLESNLGKTFTTETTEILPQLSLHTSGGPLTEVHVYGRQVAAQVYGSITATQEIEDSNVGVNTTYDQVRFYARRFGDTTVPLTLTGEAGLSGSTVSITPTEFDALDEIINGWKEVTLAFSTPPVMGTVTPRWIWSATGELAGNRWEVMGTCAPALSGIPGDLFNLVPSPNQLYTATYWAPIGDSAELQWVPQGIGSPPVTAISNDDSSDATLIFAVNPLPITGFSVATQTQEIVGIGLDCGVDPCCIPTDIIYNRINWGLPVNTGVASDDFNRTVAAGGWGTASDGHTWTTSGTAADFSVNGAEGLIAPSALNASRLAWVDVGGVDQDITVLARIDDVAESGNMTIGLIGRLTDSSNYLVVEFRYRTDTTEMLLRQRVGGVATDLISVTPTLLPAATVWRWIRLQIQGAIMRAKVWGWGTEEPDWMVTSAVTITTGTNAGVIARDNTSAAAPSTFMFDAFSVNPPDYGFGAYELQRMDTVTTDWQTIMRATNVATTGFSDFEARVGITSTYRIRGLDVYDFAGPWSSEVSIALPAPGASGGCISEGHILIFTSNERQDGSINLAYSSVWEGRVEEGFTFAEAGFVQMQAMYNRDFFTAFRPTERGGEQFQRTVLVQAAAISPETLADFTSLRDMAWEDVSYICVRDEDGNRWFATVIVPSGRVTHSRKLYMAPVQIIEVTDTPSEVDP